jgi:RimJ/RimL family protein N-acetyltransferase
VTGSLKWRAAVRGDRGALQEFTCTTKAARPPGSYRSRPHPKPWELQVQSFIRTLHPPAGADQVYLLGEDSSGIGAVCVLADQGTPEIVKIQAVAVSVRQRGQGGAHANEALAAGLDLAGDRARAAGFGQVIAVGWVHPRNQPSQLLCRRAGFAHRRDTRDGLQEWVLLLGVERFRGSGL